MDALAGPQSVWFAKQHPVDNAEHGGIGADSKGKGGSHSTRENRLRPEHAHGVTQVRPAVIEPRGAALVAGVVANVFVVAEAEPRGTTGLVRRQPLCRELLRFALDVKAEFPFELAPLVVDARWRAIGSAVR
jgi:hypothetical protein